MYGGEVYWTDWRTNTLAKANKWTGHNVTVVQRTNTQPFDLQVYHPSRQPQGRFHPRQLTVSIPGSYSLKTADLSEPSVLSPPLAAIWTPPAALLIGKKSHLSV